MGRSSTGRWYGTARRSCPKAHGCVEVAEEADDDYGPPPEPTGETRAEFLDSLRQSIADIKAGKGIPIEEAFARIRAELNLPAGE